MNNITKMMLRNFNIQSDYQDYLKSGKKAVFIDYIKPNTKCSTTESKIGGFNPYVDTRIFDPSDYINHQFILQINTDDLKGFKFLYNEFPGLKDVKLIQVWTTATYSSTPFDDKLVVFKNDLIEDQKTSPIINTGYLFKNPGVEYKLSFKEGVSYPQIGDGSNEIGLKYSWDFFKQLDDKSKQTIDNLVHKGNKTRISGYPFFIQDYRIKPGMKNFLVIESDNNVIGSIGDSGNIHAIVNPNNLSIYEAFSACY